jgi:addiction module RelE/StbE family toxin
MAQAITWAESALEDLESIAAFIGRDSPHYALTVTQTLFTAVEILRESPQAGRVVPEYGKPDLRELIWRQYRIVYKIEPGQVRVVAVVHGAQALPESAPELES